MHFQPALHIFEFRATFVELVKKRKPLSPSDGEDKNREGVHATTNSHSKLIHKNGREIQNGVNSSAVRGVAKLGSGNGCPFSVSGESRMLVKRSYGHCQPQRSLQCTVGNIYHVLILIPVYASASAMAHQYNPSAYAPRSDSGTESS